MSTLQTHEGHASCAPQCQPIHRPNHDHITRVPRHSTRLCLQNERRYGHACPLVRIAAVLLTQSCSHYQEQYGLCIAIILLLPALAT